MHAKMQTDVDMKMARHYCGRVPRALMRVWRHSIRQREKHDLRRDPENWQPDQKRISGWDWA